MESRYLLLQKVKHDIVFRHVQLQVSRQQEELQLRQQANLITVFKKVTAFLEYHRVLPFQDALPLLECITVLHD
jgi:hypothetical protein